MNCEDHRNNKIDDEDDISEWDMAVKVNYFHYEKHYTVSNRNSNQQRSPQSILHPLFRMIECGGGGGSEWTESLRTTHSDDEEEDNDTLSDSESTTSSDGCSSRRRPFTHTTQSHSNHYYSTGQKSSWTAMKNIHGDENETSQDPHTRKNSLFHPVFRMIECNGMNEDVDPTIETNHHSFPSIESQSSSSQDSVLSVKIESLYRGITSEDSSDHHHNDCDLLSPIDTLWNLHRTRKRVSQQAMVSFFQKTSQGIQHSTTAVRKSVAFQNPLVTSIKQIPRIEVQDIHKFFYTDDELIQLYKQQSNSSSYSPLSAMDYRRIEYDP